MTLLFKYLGLNHFVLFLVFISIFFITILIYKNKKYPKLTLQEYKNSPELIITYLDKYYVKNKVITFSLIIFYFFFKVSVILYVRYLYLGYEIYLIKISSENMPFSITAYLKLFVFFLILISSMFLFNFLLYQIFRDEIIKSYIYLMKKKAIENLSYYSVTFSLHNIWGPCYLFFECIYRATPTPDDYFYDDYYRYNIIYEYKLLVQITSFCINLSKKYSIIYLLVLICRKFFRMLYLHVTYNGIGKYLPIFIVLTALIYDFFCHTIFNLYYVLFITYFIVLFNNIYSFFFYQHHMFLPKLHDFFYKNTLDYNKQRNLFKTIGYKLNLQSPENKILITDLYQDETVIDTIYNNLKEEPNSNKKEFMMYLRIMMIYILSLLTIGLIYNIINNLLVYNIPKIYSISIFIILWFLVIICNRNTYLLNKENSNDNELLRYNYNKKYDILFWVIILFYFYLFWKILFKPELFFINNNILIQVPYDLFQITKIYSNEDKIYYLFQYFEYKLSVNNNIDQEYLRNILRKINFSNLINSTVTLKDIKVYIELLFDNYYYLNYMVQHNNVQYLKNLDDKIFLELFLQVKEFKISNNKILHIYCFLNK